MLNGILNVYKEKGYTSHDVVAKLRGIAGQKKIGHTGTLDPQAEGVLPVCLGKATKVCDLLTDKDKVYEAVLLLGQTTDTQDTTGTVLEQSAVTCSEEEVKKALDRVLDRKDIGILLINGALASLCRERIDDIKTNKSQPLLVEIPDRHGNGRDENAIAEYIRTAVGIKI